MERLTERGEDGKYFVRISGDNDLILGAEKRLLPGLEKWAGWWEHTVLGNIVDRLAAYEDTGLAPEEVQQMRWIPVEEKLPEKENAQVFMTDGESCFISSRNNMMCFLGCEGFFIPGKAANITHWMPPPDPPARRPPDGEKEKIFNE